MNQKLNYDELLSRNSFLEAKNSELEKEMKTLANKDNHYLKAEENLTLPYARILDNMAEGVILVRMSDGIIIYTNSRFDEMLGYNKGELLYKHVSTIDSGGTKGAVKMKNKLITALRKNEFWKGEVLNIKKDGTTFWSNLNVSNFVHPGFGEVCIAVHENISDRKLTEQRLIDSEEKFRLISEQSMLGIIIIQDDIIKYANQAAAKISEVALNEIYMVKPEKIYEYIHPDDMAFVMEQSAKKQAGDTDVTVNYTFRIITSAGKVKWIEIYSKTISYGGRPANLVTMIDITHNKQVEEDLKNSEKKFRNLFYNAQVGIFRSSIDGNRFLDLNDRMAEILGYTRSELIKLNPVDIWIDPQQRKEMMNILNSKGSATDYEILVRGKAHNTITLVLSVKLFREYGFIEGSVLDITDRKRAKEELEKSEEMYRTLLRTSPDAIVMADMEGRITYASPPAARLNYIDNPEDLIGTVLLDLLAPKDRAKGAAVFKKILEQGFANNVILRHKRINGSTFYGETNASLLIDPKGNPYGVIVTTRDITKRINDEKELLRAKEKAVESDHLKSAFLANMSHEIRTPMNGIVGFADLVKNRNISSGKRNKYLDIIVDRSKHLLNIINDIIDISKIEAGEINIIKKEFNLNKMLRKLYSFFESEIQIKDFRGVELRLKSGLEDNNSIIYTDAVRLQQILTNLISNAFKFTKEGFIEYGYTITDKETLDFYVTDTGIGLSDKEQKIIFDRFRQGENPDNELTQGTGLGLSISKGLIELLGGKIWVKSKKGSGSTFYFSIPYKTIDKTRSERTGKKEKINNNHILEGKTILIVEDDDTSFYFLKEILNETNVKLLWVKEGAEAIKVCRENSGIDLVLMDIELPMMNGYEAAQNIKKVRKDLPVIAETAFALAGEKEKAMNAGCDDYLSKPIDKDILIKKIKRLLRK